MLRKAPPNESPVTAINAETRIARVGRDLGDALRAVILENAAFAQQTTHLLVLTVWGVVCFVLALKYFRWT